VDASVGLVGIGTINDLLNLPATGLRTLTHVLCTNPGNVFIGGT
jgi:hypothetical protein